MTECIAAEYIRCDPASTSAGAAASYFEIEDHGSNKLALKIPDAGGGASQYCGLTGAASGAASGAAASVSSSCVDDDACLQARSDLYFSLALCSQSVCLTCSLSLDVCVSLVPYLLICVSHLFRIS